MPVGRPALPHVAVGLLGFEFVVGVARGSAWGFLGAWFFVILAPTSTFIPLQDAAFEHRMYLPLAAVVVGVVCGVTWLALRVTETTGGRRTAGRVLGAAAGCLVLVLAFRTVLRNEDYSSALRMYADNAAVRPNNARVRHNMALRLYEAGQLEEAGRQMDIAEQLPLRVPALKVERVRVLRELGRADEAVEMAAGLLAEDPGSDRTAFELGLSLLTAGRPADAVPHLRRMAASAPANPSARFHYGIALLHADDPAAADAEFRAVDALDPGFAGRLIKTARRVALDPRSKPSNLRLVTWYAEAACRMKADPPADFVDTWAICLARVGQYPDAVREADRAAGLARSAGDDYLAGRIEARADLFRKEKPYLPESVPPW